MFLSSSLSKISNTGTQRHCNYSHQLQSQGKSCSECHQLSCKNSSLSKAHSQHTLCGQGEDYRIAAIFKVLQMPP